MRKIIITFLPITYLFIVFTAGCSNNSSEQYQQQIAKLQQEKDSIAEIAEIVTNDYNEIFGYISTLETAMDSIAECELILNRSINREGGLTRAQIRENILNFGAILQRQRDYIKALEDSLNLSHGSASHLLTIVTTLRQQLDKKESELNRLKASLNDSRRSVNELQRSLAVISEKNNQLEEKANILENAVKEQSAAINIGYLLIAPKKELQEKGILTKGNLLKKSKVDYSAFNDKYFKEIDIRNFKTYIFSAKKPKLITPAPISSYTISRINAYEWQIDISSVADFWSVSNYLVIQTD